MTDKKKLKDYQGVPPLPEKIPPPLPSLSNTTDPFDFMLDYIPPTTTDHWALVGGPLPWDYEAVTYRNLQSGEVVTLTVDSEVDGSLLRLWGMHFG